MIQSTLRNHASTTGVKYTMEYKEVIIKSILPTLSLFPNSDAKTWRSINSFMAIKCMLVSFKMNYITSTAHTHN